MALALPGTMGVQLTRWQLETRWAPSHEGGNAIHSSRNVSLTISCCFLCSCDKHLEATLPLLLQDLQGCFSIFTL